MSDSRMHRTKLAREGWQDAGVGWFEFKTVQHSMILVFEIR